MGAQMVREVASKTNDIAGDGTTTAVRAGAGHRAGGWQGGFRRHEPDGSEAWRRQGGWRTGRRAEEAQQERLRRRPRRLRSARFRQRRGRDRRDDRRGDAKGGQRGRHHGRGSQGHADRTRRRRGHAVRPWLHVALFRHQRRKDEHRVGSALHPDPRKEAFRPRRPSCRCWKRGAVGPPAAIVGRGCRGRGARHPGGEQAARRTEGCCGEGTGFRRPPQGDARGYRDPDRRPGDQRGSRHQAGERHARICSARRRRC